MTLPYKISERKVNTYLEPEIMSRLSQRKSEKPDDHLPRNDFLQWLINYAHEKLQPEEMSPRRLAKRITVMNFAGVHTSTMNITSAIFDLASSDPSLRYAEQLREEAATVLAETGGTWTRKALMRMYKTDSALRDSMRLRSSASLALIRRVAAKDGLNTPDGLHLPYGTEIAIPSYGIHNDESHYPKPAEWDALRFVPPRDPIGQAEKDEGQSYVKNANGFVTIGATYLGFGLGRHACPGRFFASDMLKLLLAYIFLNYDIEPLKERPMGLHIGDQVLPPMKACIRVRRRSPV